MGIALIQALSAAVYPAPKLIIPDIFNFSDAEYFEYFIDPGRGDLVCDLSKYNMSEQGCLLNIFNTDCTA
ncbi:MAG: hypothetical protein PQJ61_13345 [Spirochaetales bacterium]|uniref:Uncharacterized protein n=1 Tax=Candidatus Thalassospirochaeta sargassi TaxID=3119039 RepID=A0AAJ1IEB1_9SPIO|nr:hypothetical protein [Spirochaetales bacterium]